MEIFIIKDMLNQLKKDYEQFLKDKGWGVSTRKKDYFSGYSRDGNVYKLFSKKEDNELTAMETNMYIKSDFDIKKLIERLNNFENVYVIKNYKGYGMMEYIESIGDVELEKSFKDFMPELNSVIEKGKYKKDFIQNNFFNLSYLFDDYLLNKKTIDETIVLIEQHRLDLQLQNF